MKATVMAVTAPVVVFGLLYVVLVQPERSAALEARAQLAAARDEIARSQAVIGDRSREVIDVLTAALNDPAVGGVANLSIEPGAGRVTHTPVSVTIDAKYEQIGNVLWHLQRQPAVFDVQSIEVTPQPEFQPGLLNAKMTMFVFHSGAAAPATALVSRANDAETPPDWGRNPFVKDMRPRPAPKRAAVAPAETGPDPVVSSILFSEGRRVARVDGRIVGPGDRVGQGIVESIEPGAVVIVEPGGSRRIELARAGIGSATR